MLSAELLDFSVRALVEEPRSLARVTPASVGANVERASVSAGVLELAGDTGTQRLAARVAESRFVVEVV